LGKNVGQPISQEPMNVGTRHVEGLHLG